MTKRINISVVLLMLLIILFSQCEKAEDFNVNNLNHNIIMVLGHAGMGDLYKYPNNSMESIEPVIGIGADGTELDIQMTKDSVLILYHDEKLDGRTKCGGYGSPYEYNWSEIESCIYNTVIDEIPIYTLDEVFSRLPDLNNLYFSFDCKLYPELFYDKQYRLLYLRAVRRICEKYDISRNVFLEGDLDFLLTARELGMTNKGFVIGSTIEQAVDHNIFGIGYSMDVTAEEVNLAHENGIYVMIWGAKTDAANKKAIRLNPDIVQTDKPIPMLMLFDRFNFGYKIP